MISKQSYCGQRYTVIAVTELHAADKIIFLQTSESVLRTEGTDTQTCGLKASNKSVAPVGADARLRQSLGTAGRANMVEHTSS